MFVQYFQSCQVTLAQARIINTKSNIISQDKEITKTLKKNMFPNPTHLPVHCEKIVRHRKKRRNEGRIEIDKKKKRKNERKNERKKQTKEK